MPSPARVLLISRPLRVGAYQRKAELIAADPRFELTVVVPERWRESGVERPLDRTHVNGYELTALPIWLPGRFHVHAFRGLDALIQRIRPDLVHIDEEAYNLAAFQALRAARRAGAKTLFFTWQNLKRRYPPPFSVFERSMFRDADGVIAGSESAADVVRAKGYAGGLWVVPQFGVDAERFHPPTVPRQSDLGRLRVGYAGRLVAEKGLASLLQAVAQLADRKTVLATSQPKLESDSLPDRVGGPPGSAEVTLGVPRPPITLEIIGDGPERDDLQRLASDLGIKDLVRFTARLASTEMPAFYQRIDALALPSLTTRSWKEQFGRVLIEAMACGVVCVGSDSGEIPQVIGESGLVFPEGDPEALAESLSRLARDPSLRQELGGHARDRALEHFTMKRVAELTSDVWATVLGN